MPCVRKFLVYYESIKRELKTRPIYVFRKLAHHRAFFFLNFLPLLAWQVKVTSFAIDAGKSVLTSVHYSTDKRVLQH